MVKVSKSDYSSRKRSIRVSKDFKVCLENKFYPFCVPRLENFDCCFVVQFDLECKKYCNLCDSNDSGGNGAEGNYIV